LVEIAVTVSPGILFIVTEAVDEHPAATVTVTVYVLGERPLIVAVDCPLLHK
jgi:hypothetical protein